MNKDKGTFNRIVDEMRGEMGQEIEQATEALKRKGLSERAASYASMMAYLRKRRK